VMTVRCGIAESEPRLLSSRRGKKPQCLSERAARVVGETLPLR
jgi:hypothetical protein